ncbi:glycosyltransferase family 4 protein [Legionella lytica]|uniref:Glycosyltransferase family 4 protein n=1 Tax=Legionella lytica TaxID=96232 RepID=A0ABW8DCC0_9GAMM
MKQNLPTVWMNVTTSVNWNRPPVGIVRVELNIAHELEKYYESTGIFKKCIWKDGYFKEYGALEVQETTKANTLVKRPSIESNSKVSQWIDYFFSSLIIPQNFSAQNSAAAPVYEPEIFSPGDILISMGLDWDMPYTPLFYELRKTKNVKIITCCYDLIPVLYPQYCVGDVASRFMQYFFDVAVGSDAIMCISKQSEHDLTLMLNQTGSVVPMTKIMTLGDTLNSSMEPISDAITALLESPFILFVSTIERRKNHEVLYRAYHLLCAQGKKEQLPTLIFVGMSGWGVNDLLKDIELDPLTRGKILILTHVNDAELRALYQNAQFFLYPSLYEGWGLPIAEALASGKMVLASEGGSIPEVGGDLVQYIDPWNAAAWADAMWEATTNVTLRTMVEQRVTEFYIQRSWQDTAEAVAEVIYELMQKKTCISLSAGYDMYTQVGMIVGGNIRSTGSAGYLMYGPYLSLPAGTYQIQVFINKHHSSLGRAVFDVTSDSGVKSWFSKSVEYNVSLMKADEPVVSFILHLNQSISNFELRCTLKTGDLELSSIHINDISEPLEFCLGGNRSTSSKQYSLQSSQALDIKSEPKNQFLIDVSELVVCDVKTGIQRVVRSILTEFFANPPQGFKVELVYAPSHKYGYRYARDFTAKLFNQQLELTEDEFITVGCGDIFLGLDLAPNAVVANETFYQQLRAAGVRTYFVVYDLLPILLPEVFPKSAKQSHIKWMEVVSAADGLLCISQAVADETIEWLDTYDFGRRNTTKIGWFHLGADIASSRPTQGIPENANKILDLLKKQPTFLMVGTVEPRKQHMQVLLAFEQLWDKGVKVNLVIVGKQGWSVDSLVHRLRNHSERERRLFWLESASDEYLEKIYAASSCLIAASLGEGFGLPLIEAAQYRVPIIARDIPVFREVAKDYAFYFTGDTPEALSECVFSWLHLSNPQQSEFIPWFFWQESVNQLGKIIFDEHWYHEQI